MLKTIKKLLKLIIKEVDPVTLNGKNKVVVDESFMIY